MTAKRMGYFVTFVITIIMFCSQSACQTIVEHFVFDPEALELDVAPPAGADERWIVAADGVRLHAWHVAAARSRASILWSHGRGGHIGEGAAALHSFAAHGFDVLAYDYRGYGKSEGRPSEDGMYLDAEAAFDSETARGVSRIVCFGDSLGGAVSIHLATRRPCGAVAVVSTFTSLRDMAAVRVGVLSVFTPDQFNSEALVGGLRVPFFDAHGDLDAVVPYALGERLFAAAGEPKLFLRVHGVGHDMLDEPIAMDTVIGEMARFLQN